MARTVPGRRVVVASEILAETTEAINAEDCVPEKATPVRKSVRRLSYKERLQRRLEVADLALIKYEERLESGGYLEPKEERLFLAHQDSIRKLEATLAQLEAKDHAGDTKSDQQLAIDLIDAGWTLDDACRAFQHNPNIRQLVQELLDERE